MLMKKLAVSMVGAVLVTGLLVSVAAAAPQGPWVLPAQNLSAAGGNGEAPQLSAGPDGSVTAVWTRDDGTDHTVQTATRPPGGSFGAPVNLSVAGQLALGPQIAVSPDGTATALWYSSDGTEFIVQAATRPPGGSFGTPVDLSAVGDDAIDPQISAASDGSVTAVWSRFAGSTRIIQASTRPPGGSFGDPVNLSAASSDSQIPQITTAPDGTTTVTWVLLSGGGLIVQAATRPPGGSFGTPVNLSVAGQDAVRPQIATAADGTATVVWYRSNGTNTIIQAATRPPGGSFGSPVNLSDAGDNAIAPQITIAPDGTTTAVWARYDGTDVIIQAATRPPGGSFGDPVNVAFAGPSLGRPAITAAPDGTATAVWLRNVGPYDVVQAATRPPGGSFGNPVNLSGGEWGTNTPQVTAAPDGTATAIWAPGEAGAFFIQSVSTARPSPALSVAKAGNGSGIVTSTPTGINCGSDCSENYLSFTDVTLTANPKAGSTFNGWSGADCSGAATCEVTMLEATTVTASFGKPKLANLKVTPKSKKVKPGKKATFKVKVRNNGKAKAGKLKVCAKGPKKLVKVGKCVKAGSLAAGKSKTVKFKVTVKKGTKEGRKAKITFKATASGGLKKSAKATVKVG